MAKIGKTITIINQKIKIKLVFIFFYSFGATKNLYLCTQISNTNLNIFLQTMKKTFTILIFALFPILLCGQTPAFPGAEGGGMYTTGGRVNSSGVGYVYFVNSLSDGNSGDTQTGEGTLRWCLSQPGPRTIIFKVAGLIDLNSSLNIPANTTIAGQTAPGDGICLRYNRGYLNSSNVIVRFLRFRMGDTKGIEDDAFWGRNQSNIIIDHCSMSWSTDECASFYDNENFTMQWCILSESLRNSVHVKDAHGYGGIWGGKKATFHHNLLANHDSRNPRMCGSRYSGRPDLELVDFRNNVIYNWGSNSGYAGEGGSYNFVNNYYQPAAGSANTSRIFQPYNNGGVWGTFYVAGNRMMATNGTINTNVTNDNWNGINPNPSSKSKAEIRSDVEFAFPANIVVTTHTAEMSHEKVLAYGGASYRRDSTDRRVINEVKNRLAPQRATRGTTRAGLIDTQSDVGGWDTYTYDPSEVPNYTRDGVPVGWLETNYPGKTAKDKNEEGYTYLEVYLNSLVQHIIDGQNSMVSGFTSTTMQEKPVIYYDYSTGTVRVNSDLSVKKTYVYSIQGTLVENINTPGVYIAHVTMENGETHVAKIIVNQE